MRDKHTSQPQRQPSSHHKQQRSKVSNSMKIACFIIFIIYILVAVGITALTIYLNIIPAKYMYMLLGAMVILCVIIGFLMIRKRSPKGARITGIVLAIMLIIAYALGGFYLYTTNSFFNQISDNGKDLEEYCVVVRKDSPMNGIEDIIDKHVCLYTDTTDTYLQAEKQLLEDTSAVKSGANPEDLHQEEDTSKTTSTSDTDETTTTTTESTTSAASQDAITYDYVTDINSLAKDLIDSDKDIIFASRSALDIYNDSSSGSDGTSFDDSIKVIYSIYITKESIDTTKNVDVTKEPFNIYITGIDTTGSIDVLSRSDVNMIVTINPVSKEILLTSIPRDYYVPLHSNGQNDKLTHTGTYSVGETISTVEDFMGIDINYYCKANFSTVVALVDAIGGVEVQSDYAFTTHGRQNEGFYFTEGTNQLNGSSALAFARERKSFTDGDQQRIKNQQIVLAAILDKATSSKTILTKYSSILSGLDGYIETNMSDDEIKSLVKMQIDDMASWNIDQITLEGTGSNQPVYSLGNAYASVVIPNDESIEAAKIEMTKVFASSEIEKN